MKWEVLIEEDIQRGVTKFIFYREVGPGRYSVVTPMVADGKITWGLVEVQEGEVAPVSIEITRTMTKRGFLDALAQALEDHGTRVKKDVNEEVVAAMKVHLGDLQSLIFGSDTLNLSRRGGGSPDADL